MYESVYEFMYEVTPNGSEPTLQDLKDKYIERSGIKSPKVKKEAEKLGVYLPRSTVESWRRSISNWEQAVAAAFIWKLSPSEASQFLKVANLDSLDCLHKKYTENPIWERMATYSEQRPEYEAILADWRKLFYGEQEIILNLSELQVNTSAQESEQYQSNDAVNLPRGLTRLKRWLFTIIILGSCILGFGSVTYWLATVKPYFSTASLKKHNQDVHRVSWASSHGILASSGEDTLVIIWNTEQAEAIKVLPNHAKKIRALGWCKDGQRVASGDDDHVVYVWDISVDRPINTINADGVVRGISWSPDCDRIAISTENGTLTIWDSESGNQEMRLDGHNGWVRDADWSPDGSRIASVGRDRFLIIWDAETGQPIQRLAGYADSALSWNPDGSKVAAINRSNQQIVIWDTESSIPEIVILGHREQITAIAWHPNGNYIITASKDRQLKIWDARSGKLVKTLLGHSDPIWDVDWSADGSIIASGDTSGTILLWNTPRSVK